MIQIYPFIFLPIFQNPSTTKSNRQHKFFRLLTILLWRRLIRLYNPFYYNLLYSVTFLILIIHQKNTLFKIVIHFQRSVPYLCVCLPTITSGCPLPIETICATKAATFKIVSLCPLLVLISIHIYVTSTLRGAINKMHRKIKRIIILNK